MLQMIPAQTLWEGNEEELIFFVPEPYIHPCELYHNIKEENFVPQG